MELPFYYYQNKDMSNSPATIDLKDAPPLQLYVLRLADNALILGQRLAEWCGHGPVLEQDIALTNIALDLMGQARSWFAYAAELSNHAYSEDDLAFLRDAWDFRNVLLVEQPNGDFAHTIVRQFLFDAWHYHALRELAKSKDEQIAAIAAKSLKEVSYHLRFSSEWMIRLGDGTAESRRRMQAALENLWMYSGEALVADELDREMLDAGIGVDLEKIRPEVTDKLNTIIERATLAQPTDSWMQSGGKQGRHSEHLGYILAEMQYLQRAYPGMKW